MAMRTGRVSSSRSPAEVSHGGSSAETFVGSRVQRHEEGQAIAQPNETTNHQSENGGAGGESIPPRRARHSAALVAPREASTPAQQAALGYWENGNDWLRSRLLRGVVETGALTAAARIVGLAPSTVFLWQQRDPAFKEQVAMARREAGERLFGRAYGTVLTATDEQLLLHPNLLFNVMGALLPETRQNGSTVNIDARSVNVTLLEPGQLERIKQALRASRPLTTREAGELEGGDPSSEGDDGER